MGKEARELKKNISDQLLYKENLEARLYLVGTSGEWFWNEIDDKIIFPNESFVDGARMWECQRHISW